MEGLAELYIVYLLLLVTLAPIIATCLGAGSLVLAALLPKLRRRFVWIGVSLVSLGLFAVLVFDWYDRVDWEPDVDLQSISGTWRDSYQAMMILRPDGSFSFDDLYYFSGRLRVQHVDGSCRLERARLLCTPSSGGSFPALRVIRYGEPVLIFDEFATSESWDGLLLLRRIRIPRGSPDI